jgi:enterochelin esterase-like enzyme
MGRANRREAGEPSRRKDRRSVIRRRRLAAAFFVLVVAGVAYLVLHNTLFGTDTHGATVSSFTFHSRAVGKSMTVSVVSPSGDSSGRPLLVFLHGRNASDSSYTGDEALFKALSKLGGRAPIIAFPDGGQDSYWHDRRTGSWGAYVMREVIPQVNKRFHPDPRRLAIGGISMGGFGAYDLALKYPGRFCAVGGHSPALWLHGADTAPGAFDDAADFARNDVIATVRSNPDAFGSARVWNDTGNGDPFLISDVAFADALHAGGANLTSQRWPGGHDRSYWDRHWVQYLRFYANALASCRR